MAKNIEEYSIIYFARYLDILANVSEMNMKYRKFFLKLNGKKYRSGHKYISHIDTKYKRLDPILKTIPCEFTRLLVNAGVYYNFNFRSSLLLQYKGCSRSNE